MNRMLMIATLALAGAAVGAPAGAQTKPQPRPQVQQHPHAQPQAQQAPGVKVNGLGAAQKAPVGAYVTDASGHALYMFHADKKGESSACYGACARGWPPVLAGEGQTALGPGLDRSLLGTITRKDGSKQLTYGGWPLYYFPADRAPGQTGGQDLVNSGGEWNLIAPNGNPITKE